MIERKERHNSVYIKRCRSVTTFRNAVRTYMNTAGAFSCAVEDLRKNSAEEKYLKINMEIIKKKRQFFSNEDEKQYSFSGFVLGSNDYFMVLSIPENTSAGKRLYNLCFEAEASENVSLYATESISSFSSASHYAEIMPKEGVSPARYYTGITSAYSDREEETFELPYEIKGFIDDNMENPRKSIKTITTMEVSKAVCERLELDSIIVKSVHEGGVLNSVPIIFMKEQDENLQYARIRDEYIYAHKCDSCSNQLLEAKIGYDFGKYAPLVFEFFYDHMYDEFLKNMSFNKAYCCKAYEDEVEPLKVSADLIDGRIIMTYNYATNMYLRNEILHLHDTISKYMFDILSKYFEKVVIDNVEITPAEERRREAAIRTLSKIALFDGYTPKEIDELAKVFTVRHFFMQQEIISEGCDADGIYIPVSGRIEMCSKDDDMVYRPLMLVKPGEVIGIESVLSYVISNVTYRVESNDSIVLLFNKEVFMKEVEKHNELLIRLLDIQSDRLFRFQRLWLLN